MQTLSIYLEKTKSAMTHLFNGINKYNFLLKKAISPVFLSGKSDANDLQKDYLNWQEQNKIQIQKALSMKRAYLAEYFSLSTIAGAIIQIADKAIDLYSKENTSTAEWDHKEIKNYKKYIIGRKIRDIPIGLIIHASRNQHMHFNDKETREFTSVIFEKLTVIEKPIWGEPYRDIQFDLKKNNTSLAGNIIYLLNWNEYEDYLKDIQEMLY
jgi:hypothetical protein